MKIDKATLVVSALTMVSGFVAGKNFTTQNDPFVSMDGVSNSFSVYDMGSNDGHWSLEERKQLIRSAAEYICVALDQHHDDIASDSQMMFDRIDHMIAMTRDDLYPHFRYALSRLRAGLTGTGGVLGGESIVPSDD